MPGRSTADTAGQRRVEEAAFFWLHLRNQTGQAHLSLSDYASIRDDACGGAVNEPEALVELAGRWGLGLFGSDKSAASAIWDAARNTCPEAFEDQDFAARRPPFGDGGAEPTPSPSAAPTAERVSFVDLSIFDDPQWAWSGDQMIAVAMTSLSAQETVDYLRGAFSEGWTVNEVLGPVTNLSGSTLWSLDISGNGFTGAVDVFDSDAGTVVVIAVIDGPYPLPK